MNKKMRIEIQGPTKKQNYRYIVVLPAAGGTKLPWAGRNRCSSCGKRTTLKKEHSTIVRSATKEPIYILDADLCESCYQLNQKYMEDLNGFSRGSLVKLKSPFNEKPKVIEIKYYFDETSFVGTDNFVYSVNYIDKLMPKQLSIFDYNKLSL